MVYLGRDLPRLSLPERTRALIPELRRELKLNLYAAYRTGLYGLGSALLRRLKPRPTAAQRRVLWQFWAEAFALQRDLLRRPRVASTLQHLERQDLRDLPTFALSLPSDLWRARRKRGGQSVAVQVDDAFPYPEYYLHDFHNQANGSLSAQSAATYEWQIRLLFAGTNRLMRQAIVDRIPMGDTLTVLDAGCGTASWLPQARLQGRAHRVIGVDLSPHYLSYAAQRHGDAARFVQGNIEDLAEQPDSSVDLAICIWVYHELPPEARRRATRSLARVLRPGGRLLFMDAMQQIDVPERDLTFINTRFACDFDEPYFASYQKVDLPSHFAAAGFTVVENRRIFVSKLIELRRDEAKTT